MPPVSETLYSRVEDSQGQATVCDALLYAVLGMALGWVSLPALSIETASLVSSQPEGLALAAVTGAAGTVGSTVIVPLFLLVEKCVHVPAGKWVALALVTQATAVLIGALFAQSTMGGVSWALYLVAFIGSLGANLQRLAAMPWVMERGMSPAYVSWLLAGGNATALICALLGLIQEPGGAMRFSVNAYFLILLGITAISAGAYGLLRVRRASTVVAVAPLTPSPSPKWKAHGGASGDDVPSVGSDDVPSEWLPDFAWHPSVMACVLTNSIVQYICWIVMGFLLPFAAHHASVADGRLILGYTAEASTLAVFLGSVASAVVPNSALHCGATLAAMVFCLAIILALIFEALPFAPTEGAKSAMLLISATSARFIDGLVTPLLYRRAGDEFPVRRREAITRFQGAVSITFTSLGTWVVLWMVHQGIVAR